MSDNELVIDASTGKAELRPMDPAAAAELAARRAEAQAVEATKAGRETVRGDLHGRARQALVDNASFLAVASPTNAQTLAQVRRLTRQHNAIIRLLAAVEGDRDLLVESADV